MSQVPIRLRVTLAFTLAMAIVLAAFGTFLYIQTRSQLDESIDDTLEQRAADLATTVDAADGGGSVVAPQALDPEDSFAQAIDASGHVVFSTAQVGDKAVLAPSETGKADDSESVELDGVQGIDGRVRVLATPFDSSQGPLVAVVGATLEDRDESLGNLLLLLAVGGPIALLLAGLAGYWVAGRALAPVERMRGDAASVTATDPSERLAVPAADDELRRLATTLNEMLGRLEEGIERERRFVDDASHELRTPLALHKTELEVALRYADDEAALRAAIASGIEEVDRLAQLADDLLVVARSGEDGLAVTTEKIAVAELFEAVASRFEARVRSSHRTLATSAEPDLMVRADRLRIEQALTNLIENAIRHGAGRIELAAQTSGARVKLHVRDEGVGFDPEFRERAFERFSRGDASRGRGGAGLGLAIVETIAAAHGGRAGIASLNGMGADVWIELPAGKSLTT
jgi:two-component system, OmpR family, sensor kinase